MSTVVAANTSPVTADAPRQGVVRYTPTMEISVKTLTGKVFTFEVRACSLIMDVKNKLFSSEHIPVKAQRLIFDGEQLRDKKSLADYGIEDGSTLHLVLRTGSHQKEVEHTQESAESLTWSIREAFDNKQMKGIFGAMRSRADARNTTLDYTQVEAMYDRLLAAQGRNCVSYYRSGVLQEINGEELGTTALVKACTDGDALVVAALVELGQADVDAPTKDGLTPLYAASMNAHVKIVDYLIDKGADVNLLFVKAAGEARFMEITLLLLQKCKHNPRSGVDLLGAAFKAALEQGSLAVVQLLLDRGADANACTKGEDADCPGQHGLTAFTSNGTYFCNVCDCPSHTTRGMIMHSCRRCNYDVCAQCNGRNNGATPLNLAIDRDSLDLVELLIKYDAGVYSGSPLQHFRSTPLYTALKKGNYEIVKVLLETGADPNGSADCKRIQFDTLTNISMEKKERKKRVARTPLEMAIDAAAEVRFRLVTLLLEHGATPHTGLLVCAALNGAVDVAQLLVVEYFSDPNEMMVVDTVEGLIRTPLQSAIECEHNRDEMVQFLLEYSADPDLATLADQKTPLLLATESSLGIDNLEMTVLALLGSNVDPDRADVNGMTPLYAAAAGGNTVVTAALLGAGTKSANVAHRGVTPLLAAMRNKHWAVAKLVLTASNACLVVDGAVATSQVTDALQTCTLQTELVQSFVRSLANSNSAVFGTNLRGKQLWLWSNLMKVVGANPVAVALKVTVSRLSLLDSLRADFGINKDTGLVEPGTSPRHLDVTFVGEDSSGDGLRRELLQMATSQISDLQRGLFVSKARNNKPIKSMR